jgi:hypothetical protein
MAQLALFGCLGALLPKLTLATQRHFQCQKRESFLGSIPQQLRNLQCVDPIFDQLRGDLKIHALRQRQLTKPRTE